MALQLAHSALNVVSTKKSMVTASNAQVVDCANRLKKCMPVSETEALRIAKRWVVLPAARFYTTYNSKLQFFQQRLGLSSANVIKMFVRHPPLFTYSNPFITETIEFLERAGVPMWDIAHIVYNFPQCLGYSVPKKLQPCREFLLNELQVRQEDLAHLFVSFPTVMGYSVEQNMRPKLEFFVKEMGVPLKEVTHQILRMPALLGYSLEERIKPRFAYIKHMQRKVSHSRCWTRCLFFSRAIPICNSRKIILFAQLVVRIEVSFCFSQFRFLFNWLILFRTFFIQVQEYDSRISLVFVGPIKISRVLRLVEADTGFCEQSGFLIRDFLNFKQNFVKCNSKRRSASKDAIVTKAEATVVIP
jgi:hypothetical protein